MKLTEVVIFYCDDQLLLPTHHRLGCQMNQLPYSPETTPVERRCHYQSLSVVKLRLVAVRHLRICQTDVSRVYILE